MKVGNIVDVSQIASMQCKTVLVCSFYDFEELVNIRPRPESCFLLKRIGALLTKRWSWTLIVLLIGSSIMGYHNTIST